MTRIAAALLASLLGLGCGKAADDPATGGIKEGSIGVQGGVGLHPRFSKDGSKIAFVRRPPGGASDSEEIAVMAASGGAVTVLAKAGTYLASVAFMPDGSAVVFADKDGISTVSAAGGGTPKQLVRDFAATDVDVSPEGRRLVWAVNGSDLFTADITELKATSLGVKGFLPRFSPDGTKVAFMSGFKDVKILTLADKSVAAVLTADSVNGLDWLSDGKRLVVGTNALELVTLAASGEATRKTLTRSFGHWLDVSPDDKTIVWGLNPAADLQTLSGF